MALGVLPFSSRSWEMPFLWTTIFVWLFLLKLSCADFQTCTIIHSFSLSSLSFPPFPPCSRAHTHAHAHAHTHRGESICVRHSARQRQRRWVNHPSFTAAEKSRWQQTICKWQGAVNYSIFFRLIVDDKGSDYRLWHLYKCIKYITLKNRA